MPLPGPLPGDTRAALVSLQKQIDRLNRKSSGGGILGRAGVEATFPSGMARDTNYDCTALDQYHDEGSSGVTVSGTVMTLEAGIYIVTCPAGFKADSTSGLEVHTGFGFNSPGVGRSSATAWGTSETWIPGAAVFDLNGTATFTPSVAFTTSAAGARTFSMRVNVWDFEFVRLSA